MAIIKKNFVCPYCFEKNDLYKIKFRCQSEIGRCSGADIDEIYAKHRNQPSVSMGKVIDIPTKKGINAISFKLPKSIICTDCSEKSSIRICPNCHSELPFTIGDFKDLTFAIIGAKEAGKSHYIAVLINRIQNHISMTFDANMQPINDETITRYRQDFYNPIFVKKEIIQGTDSARANFNVRLPLIYTLSFMGKSMFGLGGKKISSVTNLVFFDTAGEDLNEEEIMRTENKYIYNSQGIIILVDPLQIPEVRNLLGGKGIEMPNVNTETRDIITRVANLIRRATSKKPTQLIDTPIIVAFSKIDALQEILDPTSPLNYEGRHDGYFNKEDFDSVSNEIESRLAAWSGHEFIQNLRLNFSNYAFCGLSALGSNPHGQSKIPKLRPLRVEDPFLWLLHHHKVIKAKK